MTQLSAFTYNKIGPPPAWKTLTKKTVHYRVVVGESVSTFDEEEFEILQNEDLVYEMDLSESLMEVQDSWME